MCMRLREIRRLKNLTQMELQKRTGIQSSRISAIEHHYVVPRISERKKLERSLEAEGLIDWGGRNRH
jgi:transcriptional regulator with XRE-family HTH domain